LLDLEGFTSEIDVLILNTTEALRYLDGENVSVLGHASLINTDSWDAWSYTFPEQNTYSIILDNTDSPVGGGAETRPIHAEILVDEATLSSSWFGWTKSRHYIEDDSYLTFDLGELYTGDELYYSVSGKHFGSGFMPGFDVALMTNAEYQKMVAGETPEIVEAGSKIDTWFASLSSYEVEADGEYVLVIEIGDKIAGGSNDDGAWMMDFTVKSLGSVSLEQAMDQNYWLTATHHTQVPEGTTTIDDQDGQRNIGNTQAEDDSGGGAGGLLAVCCGLPILLLVVRRRRKKSAAQQIQLAIEDGIESALSAQQQTQPVAPATPPQFVSSQEPSPETPAQSVDGNGYEWFTTPDGTNFYRTAGSGSAWFKFEN
jgi:hypothetical protein